MQFSLRALLIAFLLVGPLVAWRVREYRLSIPDRIPVTYSTTQILDVDVPTEVLVWQKRSVRRATIAAEKAHDEMLRKLLPTDADILQTLLNDPADFEYFSDREHKVIAANREVIRKKSPVWLSKNSSHQTLVAAAHVLAVLDDRRGFDLAIARLPQITKEPDGPQLVQKLACSCPKDWAIESAELMRATRKVYDKQMRTAPAAPNGQLTWVLYRSGDQTPLLEYHRTKATSQKPFYSHTRSLMWLSKNERSEEWFERVKVHFGSAQILSDPYSSKLLELYLQSENESWRAEAFDIAKRLIAIPVGKRGYHVDAYHRLICAHGDREFLDYFKRHVEDNRCLDALRALGRLLPRDEYLSMLREKKFYDIYLEEVGDDAIPFLLERFAQNDPVGIGMIAKRLAGTKDSEAIAVIRKRLESGVSFWDGVESIAALETIGDEVNRDALMDQLEPPPYDPTEPYSTTVHCLINRVTKEDFLKFVSQHSGKKPLTVKEAFDKLEVPDEERDELDRKNACRLMAATGIAKEFVVDNWQFSDVGLVARDIAALFAEDLPFDSVGFEDPFLRFATKKRTFEVKLNDTHSWYDPVAIVDVLNSILDENSDSPKRLYCFDMAYDWCFVTIAYLDPDFVEELGETFAVYPFDMKRVRLNSAGK